MNASLVDRRTARHVIALWPTATDPVAGIEPDEADRLLYLAASVLEGKDLDRLELVFPKHVAAVKLLRADGGRDILRALAVAGA